MELNYIRSIPEPSPNPVVKIIVSVMLFCALLPTAFAQGNVFTNILRSVTGTVGRPETPAATPQTAVLGVRGMDEGDAKASAPAGDGVKLIDSWAVGRTEAEAAASRRGLTARSVEYGKATADTANPQGSQ
ncbi:MAG: hypothetical protein FD157_2267 [Rhodocyclaceae bacterium]|nr:MAG: hypothetical protein FD157_2267 [Rhodocyclaceae bacterium]TND04174.1 MAG: hypothetical protein FD118_1032 [Rhodocyclaceae bacterium]